MAYEVAIVMGIVGCVAFYMVMAYFLWTKLNVDLAWPIVLLWLGTAFILVNDLTFLVHQFATNPSAPDITAGTRAAYIIALGTNSFTLLLTIIYGIRSYTQWLWKTGKRWRN